jgi:hypothetical protein
VKAVSRVSVNFALNFDRVQMGRTIIVIGSGREFFRILLRSRRGEVEFIRKLLKVLRFSESLRIIKINLTVSSLRT